MEGAGKNGNCYIKDCNTQTWNQGREGGRMVALVMVYLSEFPTHPVAKFNDNLF